MHMWPCSPHNPCGRRVWEQRYEIEGHGVLVNQRLRVHQLSPPIDRGRAAPATNLPWRSRCETFNLRRTGYCVMCVLLWWEATHQSRIRTYRGQKLEMPYNERAAAFHAR